MNYLDAIIDALQNLDNLAHISDICEYIEKNNTLDYFSNRNWKEQVSNSITTHSVDSGTKKQGENIFYTPKYRSGYWGLRGTIVENENIDIEDCTEYNEFPEGSMKKVLVNAYERNPNARKKCLNYYGVKCSICGFEPAKIYGNDFKNLIHVHHIKPLHEIRGAYEVDPIKDLRPICPNCHMIIHSRKPALSIEYVQGRLKGKDSK